MQRYISSFPPSVPSGVNYDDAIGEIQNRLDRYVHTCAYKRLVPAFSARPSRPQLFSSNCISCPGEASKTAINQKLMCLRWKTVLQT